MFLRFSKEWNMLCINLYHVVSRSIPTIRRWNLYSTTSFKLHKLIPLSQASSVAWDNNANCFGMICLWWIHHANYIYKWFQIHLVPYCRLHVPIIFPVWLIINRHWYWYVYYKICTCGLFIYCDILYTIKSVIMG